MNGFLGLFKTAFIFITLIVLMSCSMDSSEIRRDINFNPDWHFLRIDDNQDSTNYNNYAYDHSSWEKVSLPHTAKIEPLVVNNQWQGTSWYRKEFIINPQDSDKKVYIEFEGAMQVADVWINDHFLMTHEGGYLPFTIDITKYLNYGDKNLLAIKLDNRDNKDVPPGKPLKTLDFCYYGGVYRNVKMHIVSPVHISDAVYANTEAGGGVLVNYKNVTSEKAEFIVKTHILNSSEKVKAASVKTEIYSPSGEHLNTQVTDIFKIEPDSLRHVNINFVIDNPVLWDIDFPKLYNIKSSIIVNDEIVDVVETKTGMRSISFFAKNGFIINGKKKYLRGANRHQEYPYIGNALSDEAQFRDAYKIKHAGFDYVRLSHYPQAEAFMNACDELGLVVMNCIPGWQFMGNEKFQRLCYQNIRDLIRRDRNHPCVVLWETSLNESLMQDDFIEMSQNITHAELPGKYTFSCGWQKGFDVFIQARQHGGLVNYDDPEKGAVVSEYGDWEYYAQNAGLDQPGFKNLLKEERNSRQFRADGEKRMLQQAMNFQEAHNDNLKTIAAGDGLWVMFDYNRGYDSTIEASGPMDIFRIPKFAHYFFQSQRDHDFKTDKVPFGPMVFIANYWTENSSKDIRVYSNCESVELYLNGNLIERKNPDQNPFTTQLKHPPFTFNLKQFEAGELIAVGLIDDNEAARYTVKTPQFPNSIQIEFDLSGKAVNKSSGDVIFAYAKITDENGTVIPDYSENVQFNASGPVTFVGQNPIKAEAGIAAILLKTDLGKEDIVLSAQAVYKDRTINGQARLP